ncbi:B12-binding domain-containing radical SAM protein [Paraclostridium sordellii]|uniref:B12-binding domain-containing radical SAM protein n=1 Tax=Paraclostridium sordellii TaxID=1505 RepID=UPI0005E9CE2A|nr:radical SAM protein [Paeniclostridium sordellii]CEQ18959.1 cobalamin B12-binding domain-containing protein [[Clostridium] sordellii] [Paeniclostridium sordellii]
MNINKYEYKTLLISISRVWRYSNTGVDQIAGYLKENNYKFTVKYYHNGQSASQIIDDIPIDFNLYGFSVHSSNYQKSCEVAKYIKKMNPNAIIVFGGTFPTIYYREIMCEHSFLDYIILGDGEKPLQILIDHLISKREEPLLNRSIVSKTDNIGKIPYCNKEISYSPVYYYYENDIPERNARKIYCLQTKNNICTGKCAFCIERKGPIVYKEIDQIVEEIRYVAHKFGIKKFFFTDDNILDPDNKSAKERIRELCYKIKALNMNLVFECYIKAISLRDNKDDNELLKLMAETGFVTIFVGLESGNNQDLILYNKRSTVEDNYKIIEIFNRHNVNMLMGFIYFNPYSTLETVRKNYEFLTNIKSTNLFHYISTFLSIHKYTEIYEKAKNDELLTNDFGILNNMSYEFKDKEVYEIVKFIRTFMSERARNLEYELDWIYTYYKECVRINSKALKYDEEFRYLKSTQFVIMKEFFYNLYVENDLEKCRYEVDEFMEYFENIQSRLSEIYKDLVILFSYD